MTLNITLTRRLRRRTLKSGVIVEQVRFVLNWHDPRTGAREQRFFDRQKDAQERRAELVAAFDRGAYSSSNRSVTVGDAVAAWLESKRGVVRPITFASYEFEIGYIVGPLLPSEARKAIVRSGVGARPKARAIELLGRVKVQELTTRRIRAWHKLISEEVSVYSANKALIKLKAALALAAEDHEFRPPAMPTGLQRQRDKARKAVLTPDEVARLLAAARDDLDKGVYYSAPFLMGTRPSEQLGLMWDDVEFEANVIRIRRIQLRYGSLSRVHQDGGRPARYSNVAAAARDAARLARALPAQGRRASPRVPCPRRPARLAFAARRGRRAAGLRKLPQALLGSDPEASRSAGGHAAQRPAFLHLDAAGAGRRGGPRRQARRPQERGRHVEPLHPRDARRGRGREGARQGVCGKRVMRGRVTGNEAGGARWPTERTVSHFMKAPAAAALLRAQYGEAEARKVALTEQRRAKRARSKRRFAFWAEVAAQIEKREPQ